MPISGLSSRDVWLRELNAAGFTWDPSSQSHRLRDIGFRLDRSFAVLSTQRAEEIGRIGAPGLWRCVEHAGSAYGVFEVPIQALDQAGEDPLEASPFGGVLGWALATLDGSVPEEVRSPAQEQLEEWIPAEYLTIRQSTLARQCEVLVEPDRLALRCPILYRMPRELPGVREEWIQEVLSAGRNRFRMVRAGLAGDAVRAEVDLTGAPFSVLEGLVRAALASLRLFVEWVLAPIVFLASDRTTAETL